MQDISPKEAVEKINFGIQVIDVRTPEEYAEGRIIGSININVSAPDFSQRISAQDKNKECLVYCWSGGRSSTAQRMMAEVGFQNVYNLAGGITAWIKDGLPTTRD